MINVTKISGAALALQLGAFQVSPTDTADTRVQAPLTIVRPVLHESGADVSEKDPFVQPYGAPAIVTSPVAKERAPLLVAKTAQLAALAHQKAGEFGVSIQKLDLRADWSEEDDSAEFDGVVLDVFVAEGASAVQFEFWDALATALESQERGDECDLSVMVHAV